MAIRRPLAIGLGVLWLAQALGAAEPKLQTQEVSPNPVQADQPVEVQPGGSVPPRKPRGPKLGTQPGDSASQPNVPEAPRRLGKRFSAGAKSQGLAALPAPDEIHLECPSSLDYALPARPNADSKMTGWQRTGPSTHVLRMPFAGVGDQLLGSGVSWVRDLECHYEARVERGDNLHVKLSRKVHPSGELYACRKDGRRIDCTLVPEDER